eukprot:3028499-Rhodomonas_salina.2
MPGVSALLCSLARSSRTPPARCVSRRTTPSPQSEPCSPFSPSSFRDAARDDATMPTTRGESRRA